MRPGTVRREHRFDDAKIVFDGGGSLSSRLLLRGWQTGRARTTAMFACALFAQPIALAAQAPSMWVAVPSIGLACAAHQGFSVSVYALPGDLFPRDRAGLVIGFGVLSGAVGGMIMAKFAGTILDMLGSYQPIFLIASCAYSVAFSVIPLLVPRYTPVAAERTG